MPNEKTLSEKKLMVETLTEKLRGEAGVLVNYSGINVVEDTELRTKLREAEVDYTVVKNTLMRLAIKNVGYEELDPVLNGTTSLAVSGSDPIAPARIIKEYSTKLADHFVIKGGFMNGKVLSADEVSRLASIPPLPILRAQVLGTMLAPIVSFAVVIKAIAEKMGGPAEDAAEVSAETVAETVAETPVEALAETVVEAPAETVAETVIEATAEVPAEAPAAE